MTPVSEEKEKLVDTEATSRSNKGKGSETSSVRGSVKSATKGTIQESVR